MRYLLTLRETGIVIGVFRPIWYTSTQGNEFLIIKYYLYFFLLLLDFSCLRKHIAYENKLCKLSSLTFAKIYIVINRDLNLFLLAVISKVPSSFVIIFVSQQTKGYTVIYHTFFSLMCAGCYLGMLSSLRVSSAMLFRKTWIIHCKICPYNYKT